MNPYLSINFSASLFFFIGLIVPSTSQASALVSSATDTFFLSILIASLSLIVLFTCKKNRRLKQALYFSQREEQKIRTDYHWLTESQKVGSVATWEHDLTTGETSWNEHCFRFLGFEPDEIVPNRHLFMALVHPDDRRTIGEKLDGLLMHKQKDRFVHRIFKKDGTLVYLEQVGKVVLADDGQPMRLIGVSTDVTARKTTEIQLLEEQKTMKLILENSPTGIWLQDKNGKLLFVNSAFCQLTGVDEQTFLAVDHYYEIFPEEIAENCMLSDAACMLQNEPHRSRETVICSDGRVHHLDITKIRIRDHNDEIKGLIGMSVDVTDYPPNISMSGS